MNVPIIIRWLLRLVPAAILLQTLYFKFSAHPESVALFTKLGVEPWGRIGTGIIELITGILLLVPATTRFGSVLSIGLMAGAIASHLFVVGIVSNQDGGFLFILALVVLLASLINVVLEKDALKQDLKKLSASKS